jgi:hypothetical protein
MEILSGNEDPIDKTMNCNAATKEKEINWWQL